MNIQLVQQLPIFSSLPVEEYLRLGEVLHPAEYSPGQILFYEGELGDHFSILIVGEVEIIKALGEPGERVLAVLGPGEFIGEMSLMYQDRKRSASARALTHVQLLHLDYGDFNALLVRQPELAFRIMQEMALRLRNSENATIRDLLEKNQELEQAYFELKTAQAELIQKEMMEHDLKMARQIQESSLPKAIPTLSSWRLEAFWRPARDVSGDFYDFFSMEDGRMALVIGDVTGKGVPAALVMATTRSMLHAITSPHLSPGVILQRANALLCNEMPPAMFVTCLFAVFEPHSGCFRFANAGHNLPFQITQGGIVEPRATGLPLGLMSDVEYEENEILLGRGESLLLYSDGLVEAHNPQGEMFGFPRLRGDIARVPVGCDSIKFIMGCLYDFTGPDWEQEDDITLLTLTAAKDQKETCDRAERPV